MVYLYIVRRYNNWGKEKREWNWINLNKIAITSSNSSRNLYKYNKAFIQFTIGHIKLGQFGENCSDCYRGGGLNTLRLLTVRNDKKMKVCQVRIWELCSWIFNASWPVTIYVILHHIIQPVYWCPIVQSNYKSTYTPKL